MAERSTDIPVQSMNEREVFVGPRPFERAEEKLFFGRDREISELLSLVTSNRVVLCYAPSGAGKTSLINAGLQPRLEREGFEVLPSTRVRGLIPEGVDETTIANIYVFNAVLSLAKETGVPAELTRCTLTEYLSTVPHLTDAEDFSSPRILIFDQFEELLTSYLERWQEREGFFQQVHGALQEDPLLRVLFVMREDFVARIEPFMRILKPLQQTRFRLDLLGPNGAQAAVTGPLRGTHRRFKDGVVETLIEELRKVRVESTHGEATEVIGEYVEPVQLQVVCRNLWTSLPDDVHEISHEHVKAYGDVDQALREFYESCLTGARSGLRANEADLRQWFERQLVTPAGTRGIVFRDAQQTAGLSNVIVDFLENRHIIRGEWRAGSRWYELTHDRLIEPIQRANERWRSQRQSRRNRILGFAGAVVALTLVLFSALLSFQQPFTANPQSAYTQSASTVVAVQTVAQEQVDVAQENATISLSRQLAAQALLTDDPELARLLAVQANEFYDTAESRKSLHRILSKQANLDTQFLQEFNPQIITPTLVKLFENHTSFVLTVAFSPDGRHFVSAGADSTILLWDVATAEPIGPPLTGHKGNILTVTFSPDGNIIASAGLDGQIIFWDAFTGQRLGDPLIGRDGIVTSLAFSPDGERLAAGEEYDTVQIWDVETGASLAKLSHPNAVWSVAWSPNGRYIASGSADSALHVWDAATFREVRTMRGHRGIVRTVAWSPDGKTLASGSIFETNKESGAEVGEVILWDAETGRKIAQPLQDLLSVSIRTVAFDPTGRILAIGRGDYTVILWDTQTGAVLADPLRAHRGGVMSLAFSPDGRYLVSGSLDKKVALWDLHPPVRSVAVDPGGALLASSQGNIISLWDLSAGVSTPIKILDGSSTDILALAFSHDGSMLASSARDGTIHIWEPRTGELLNKIQTTGGVSSLAFSPDNLLLASGYQDGSVLLWDLASGEPSHGFAGDHGAIVKIQFEGKGSNLSALGTDGSLLSWDLTSSPPQQAMLPGAQGGVASVALSQDGQKAAYFQDSGDGEAAVLSTNGRAHGIYLLSFWNQSFDPNVNADDIDFVIIKATEGTQFVDPKFEDYVSSIQSVPMRGAFHYFRAGQPWKDQADLFLATVKDKGFQFYILEVEDQPQENGTDFLGDAEKWLKYVAERADSRIMLASIGSYLAEIGATSDWIKDWPLLIIEYPFKPDRNANPALPEGFSDWRIWNYTDKGSGKAYGVGTGNIFLLVYNGTPLEMSQWLGINTFSIVERNTGNVVHPKQAIQVSTPDGMVFSPDGSYLAVAGPGTVKLLDTTSRETTPSISAEEVSTLIVGGRSIFSLAFLPDGNSLVMGTDDGTILLWDLSLLGSAPQMQRMIDIACSQVHQNFTEDEWDRYVSTTTDRKATCPNVPLP